MFFFFYLNHCTVVYKSKKIYKRLGSIENLCCCFAKAVVLQNLQNVKMHLHKRLDTSKNASISDFFSIDSELIGIFTSSNPWTKRIFLLKRVCLLFFFKNSANSLVLHWLCQVHFPDIFQYSQTYFWGSIYPNCMILIENHLAS